MVGWHHQLDGHEFWVGSGCWWWTGKPGTLQFMGSQRVGHKWGTELNWIVHMWWPRLPASQTSSPFPSGCTIPVVFSSWFSLNWLTPASTVSAAGWRKVWKQRAPYPFKEMTYRLPLQVSQPFGQTQSVATPRGREPGRWSWCHGQPGWKFHDRETGDRWLLRGHLQFLLQKRFT